MNKTPSRLVFDYSCSDTSQELAGLNRLKDPNLIITGETIIVPFNRDSE